MNKQTFLLQEVIDDLVNTDKSLISSLMKLNYFGRLIKNHELIEYSTNELNGYKSEENIPDYRKTFSTLYIDIQAYRNIHTKVLPIAMLEEPYKTGLKYFSLRDGISTIEKMTKESHNPKNAGEIVKELPIEMMHNLQPAARKLYITDVRIDVVGARITGNASIVIEIPNAIRTKLLDFVMNIADTFGYDIEIESFNKKQKINNQTIINQMSTIINNSGDGNIINTGKKNQIDNSVNLQKGNFERLEKELQQHGIEQEDIQELNDIISAEEPDYQNQKLGEKSNDWILKTIGKSLNGIGKIGIGISSNVLATLIKQYYGIE